MDSSTSYTAGSSVLPPPSYDEAVRMGMQTSHKGAEMSPSTSASVPPQVLLSSIYDYTTSWLYPAMVMVGETLELVNQELDSMEDTRKPLGQKLQGIQCKSYPAMIIMSLTGMASIVEGDPLTHGMEPWKASEVKGLFDDGNLNWRRNVNYSMLKAALQESMKTLRSWIQEELTLDKEWKHRERQRVPYIEHHEFEKLKNSMREVTDIIITVRQWRRQHDTELRLEDFATDFLVKMDMEYLLSFLKRIGDHEKGGNSSTHLSAQEESASVSPSSLVPSAPDPDGVQGASCLQTTQVPAIPSAPSIGMATASCESKSPQPPSTPPLSSVSKYQNSPLYQLLLRLKESIMRVTEFSSFIGHSGSPTCLKEKIDGLRPSQLKGLKDAALEGIMSSVDISRYENDDNRIRKNDVRMIVKKLLLWIRAQQKLDEEWSEITARVPTLSAEQRLEMKRAFTLLLNKIARIQGDASLCMVQQTEYIEALVNKEELETLWSLLTRIAEDELYTVPHL